MYPAGMRWSRARRLDGVLEDPPGDSQRYRPIPAPTHSREGSAARRLETAPLSRFPRRVGSWERDIEDAFDTADDPVSFSTFPFICLQPERLNRTAFGGFATLHVIERDLPSSENDKPADGIASFGHTCR